MFDIVCLLILIRKKGSLIMDFLRAILKIVMRVSQKINSLLDYLEIDPPLSINLNDFYFYFVSYFNYLVRVFHESI